MTPESRIDLLDVLKELREVPLLESDNFLYVFKADAARRERARIALASLRSGALAVVALDAFRSRYTIVMHGIPIPSGHLAQPIRRSLRRDSHVSTSLR